MEVPGLRERRRRATETTIERAALTLFAERGFDRVTMDQVAEAAEVSTRTAFRYFPAKVDLVLGRLRRLEDAVRPALEGAPGLSELEDRIAAALDSLLAEQAEVEHLLRAHALVRDDPALRSAAAVALGGTTPDGDHSREQRLVLSIAGATLRTAFVAWAESDEDASPTALASEYRSLCALRRRLR